MLHRRTLVNPKNGVFSRNSISSNNKGTAKPFNYASSTRFFDLIFHPQQGSYRRGVRSLIFEHGEMEVLRLCGWCKDLPVSGLQTVPRKVVELLAELGLIRMSKSGWSWRLTKKGDELLLRAGYEFEKDKQQVGRGAQLMRRIHVAEITAFFWRMGLDVFLETPPAKMQTDGFFPAFTLRRKKASEVLGYSQVCGFCYMGQTVFVPYYVEAENDGIYADTEQRMFRSEGLSCGRTPFVMYTALGDTKTVTECVMKDKRKNGMCTTDSFRAAAEKFSNDVAIVPLTLNGIRQLRILAVPQYRELLVHAILADNFTLSPIPQSDGRDSVTGNELIIGIDGNIPRFERVIRQSSSETHIYLLPDQATAVKTFLAGKNAVLHIVNEEEVERVLGLSWTEPAVSTDPFQTEKGEYLHASIV